MENITVRNGIYVDKTGESVLLTLGMTEEDKPAVKITGTDFKGGETSIVLTVEEDSECLVQMMLTTEYLGEL